MMWKHFFLGLMILSIGTIANTQKAMAQEPKYQPFQGWVGTGMTETTRPEGKYRMRLLQRYATPDVSPFLIGSIIYIQAPKVGLASQRNHSSFMALEFLRKSMDVKKWDVRKQKNATVLEAYWDKANRAVRIYFEENEREISYSIAMFRPGYSDSVGFESELMQQQLANVLERKLPWLDKLMSRLESMAGISAANAAVDTDCVSQCVQQSGGFLDANTCAQQYCTVPDPVTPPAPTPGIPNAPAEPTAPTAPPAPAASAPAIDMGAIFQGPGFKDAVSGSLNDFLNTENGKGINATVATAGSSMASISGSIKQFEKLVDPQYLVAGTVAIMSTGFVMGAVSSGIQLLSEALVEFITNAKDTKARSEAFEKAMTEYKKLQDLQPDLEKEIDGQLKFIRLAKVEAGGTENLLYFARTAVAKDKRRLKKIDRALEDGASEEACIREQVKLETRVFQLEGVVKALNASDSMESMCSKANLQITKLSEMEAQMQKFHSNLMNGIDLWVKHWDQQFKDTIEKSDDYEKRLKKAQKLEKKGAKEISKMLELRLQKDKKRLEGEVYKECYSQKEPFWSWVPAVGYLVTGNSRKECEAAATNPESEMAKKFAARAEDIRKGIEARIQEEGEESVFNLLAKQAHAGEFRPGFELNSMAYADQKEWLKKVAQDHTLKNMGAALKEKREDFKSLCGKAKAK